MAVTGPQQLVPRPAALGPDPEPLRTVTVILAAGEGSRLGSRGKALVSVHGRTLMQRAVQAATDAGTVPLLVLGHRAEEALAVLDEAVALGEASAIAPEVVVCPNWHRGLSASFRTGIQAARDRRADRVAVVLVDQPGIGAEALRRVLDAHRPGRVARGVVQGRPTHPVVFEIRAALDAAAAAQQDEGARAYLRDHPELLDAIDLTDCAEAADIDTPEDLLRWRAAQAPEISD
ncbi:NTP transferase domain-containing protein [Nesterenkonia sp. Act20]|uniref:nucleotidyltransferase family protein n=1 Tax=Nesterenkonia sp. Act20 TaxID=1483432 RepID=UPI001C45140B|nr:nucleotidyltransferase family protein [Nesterenkonia sp. Act20]